MGVANILLVEVQHRCLSKKKKNYNIDGKIEVDVNHRMRARWMKYRSTISFYKIAIRPTVLYGAECWAIEKLLRSNILIK